jgi:hypothetical protein
VQHIPQYHKTRGGAAAYGYGLDPGDVLESSDLCATAEGWSPCDTAHAGFTLTADWLSKVKWIRPCAYPHAHALPKAPANMTRCEQALWLGYLAAAHHERREPLSAMVHANKLIRELREACGKGEDPEIREAIAHVMPCWLAVGEP